MTGKDFRYVLRLGLVMGAGVCVAFATTNDWWGGATIMAGMLYLTHE